MFSVIWRETVFSILSEAVAKCQGGIFHPSPKLLPSQVPGGKTAERAVFRKNNCGKMWLKAP